MTLLSVTPQIIAISIATNVILFCSMGILLLPVNFLFSAGARSVTLFLFSLATFYSWLSVGLQDRLELYARLILAAGMAAAMVRWMWADPERQTRVRRSLRAVVAGGGTVGLFCLAFYPVMEQALASRLPDAGAALPNFLVVIVDTLRADHVSSYGYKRPTTPYVDRMARNGVLFERAFATSSWTLPSHVSILTGQLPSEHGVEWCRSVSDQNVPIGEVLTKYGYRTGGFSGNFLFFSRARGFDKEFQHFEDIFFSVRDGVSRTMAGRTYSRLVKYLETRPKALRYILEPLGLEPLEPLRRADDLAQAVIQWTSSDQDRPFLAVVNFFDLHGPDLAPEPFREMFVELKAPFGPVERLRWRYKQSMDQRQLRYVVDTYDGALAYVDYHLRLLVDELERRSGARRTIVIVTSDHGEQFREHGDIGHGTSLLNEEIHVPLVIYAPGLLRGTKRIETPVSLASIPATILELAGLPPAESFREPSLVRLMDGGTDSIVHPNPAAELSPIPQKNKDPLWDRSLVTSRWHYIRHKEHPEELFDNINDPGERLNRAEASDDRLTLLRLRAELNRRLPQPPACTGKS
jgi:arylsulfatase A-like enzyme